MALFHYCDMVIMGMFHLRRLVCNDGFVEVGSNVYRVGKDWLSVCKDSRLVMVDQQNIKHV